MDSCGSDRGERIQEERIPCARAQARCGGSEPYAQTHRAMKKSKILSEFWAFLVSRKKLWLMPIFIVLVLLSLLIVVTQGSAVAPFIYALF